MCRASNGATARWAMPSGKGARLKDVARQGWAQEGSAKDRARRRRRSGPRQDAGLRQEHTGRQGARRRTRSSPMR